MHKLKYKSDDGAIECTIVIRSSIAKDKAESIFKTLMLHLETHIGVHSHKLIFDRITLLRSEFLNKVFEQLVEDNLEKGHQVPPHMLHHLHKLKPGSNWSYDDD